MAAKQSIPATNGAPIDIGGAIQVPPAPPPFIPREPTPNDRLAIRQKLDGCFDDAAGNYLGGESDETIAKALNCPRAWVTNIREAAYGPIRVSAEFIECRKLIDGLAARHDDFGRDIALLRERLEKLGG